jgi:hypothetical protein
MSSIPQCGCASHSAQHSSNANTLRSKSPQRAYASACAAKTVAHSSGGDEEDDKEEEDKEEEEEEEEAAIEAATLLRCRMVRDRIS